MSKLFQITEKNNQIRLKAESMNLMEVAVGIHYYCESIAKKTNLPLEQVKEDFINILRKNLEETPTQEIPIS